jgi:hypothetical protein
LWSWVLLLRVESNANSGVKYNFKNRTGE